MLEGAPAALRGGLAGPAAVGPTGRGPGGACPAWARGVSTPARYFV